MTDSTSRRPPLLLWIGLGAFVLVLGFLITGAVLRPEVPIFVPTVRSGPVHERDSLHADTVTIDAGDSHAWRFYTFGTGTVDSAGRGPWDVGLRRFQIVSGGPTVDLGVVRFEDVRRVPDTGWVDTQLTRDTINEALDRWYDYSFFSHLLQSKEHVYVVRTRDGRYAKVQFLSYYCPGNRPGCVTFRYVFQGAGGLEFD